MIEGLQLTIPRRMILLRTVLTFSLIISVILSFNLWAGERSFPCAPALNLLGDQPVFNYLIVLIMLLFWAGSMLFRWHRMLIFCALALSALLVLADLNRLQPWFYIYSSMMFIFVFYNGRVDDPNKFTSYFILLQIILASVYFFCGLNQLNASFVESEFTAIVDPIRSIVSERQFVFVKKVGLVVPYLLMFIGIGLVVYPVRYLAITLALGLHLLLLILLFPSYQNHHYALWFSNLSFIPMLILLFSGRTKQRYFSPAFLAQMPLFYATVALFVILPFTNLNGFWPDYLSSNFKSGRNKRVAIKIKKHVYQNLPLYEKTFCKQQRGTFLMDYERWCADELGVECYPEKPIFNSIYQYISTFEKPDVKESELALSKR